jgi:hypothetical protein
MATIVQTDGTSRTVKNLGWLLRHWAEVQQFELRSNRDGTGRMVAYLTRDRRYETDWASCTLAARWIHRPVFAGVPVQFRGYHPDGCTCAEHAPTA